MCSLQRPLDDKTQLRVLVEAEAVLVILALCESGDVELIASDALVFENVATPDVVRRNFAAQAMGKATCFILLSEQIGVVDTFRFINQFTTGHGSYTEERDALFGHLTLADIVSAIEEKRSDESPEGELNPTDSEPAS